MSDQTPAVVGIAACGKIQGVTVHSGDGKEDRREAAKFVAKMVRQGLRIETWTVEAVRAGTFCSGCEVCSPGKKRGRKSTASTQTEAAL